MLMKLKDNETIIPKWVVKNTEQKLSDGNMVIFSGKNPNDNCIIVKDQTENIHVNFTIKKDEFELHLKNEKTNHKEYFLNVYSSVIVQLTEYWWNKQPDLVKSFPAKNWNRTDSVIDIHSNKVPILHWKEGVYDIDPNDVEPNSMFKEDVIKMKFKVGIIFNHHGECRGLLVAFPKKKKLILVDKQLLERVINTAIGIDTVKTRVLEAYKRFKEQI